MKHFLKIVLMLMKALLLSFDYIADNTAQEFRTRNKSFKYSGALPLNILMDPQSVAFD